MKKGVKLLFIGALLEVLPSVITFIYGVLLNTITIEENPIFIILSPIILIGELLKLAGFIVYLIGVTKLKKEYPVFITAFILLIVSIVCTGLTFLNSIGSMFLPGLAALNTIISFVGNVASYTARFFVIRAVGIMISDCRNMSNAIYKLYYVAIIVFVLSGFFDEIPQASLFMSFATDALFLAIDVMMVVLLGKANKVLSVDQTMYYY